MCLYAGSAVSQTQFLDQYTGIVVSEANTVGTQDQGWITVADVQIDSLVQSLAVLKFDMCGDLQWSNLYKTSDVEFHHGEVFEDEQGDFYITLSNNDLSQTESGVFLLKLDATGNVISGIQHSMMGQFLNSFNIGTDLDVFADSNLITEASLPNLDKCLAVFENGDELKWIKNYPGLTRLSSPMAVEVINDSMIFVTNTFQVALLDTSGEVLWAMGNDSVVIWPEIAFLDDNTLGILVSPLIADSIELLEKRRYTHLVTFPQATPNPVMHKGVTKMFDMFPELHAVGGKFVMASIDTFPESDAFGQTFTIFDQFGNPEEHKFLSDFLMEGAPERMPFVGFDFNGGFSYVTYADADSSVYFGKLDAGMEVGDMMACIPETRDTFLDELQNWWVEISITADSVGLMVDTAEFVAEPLDTIVMLRQCENEIPDGEQMRPICPGDTIQIGGRDVFEEGTYMDTMEICGEEIITTYEVTFIELPDIQLSVEICPGDSIFFGGQFRHQEGTYKVTFRDCGQDVDSVLTLIFRDVMLSDVQLTQEICPGEFVFFNGENRTEPGEYRFTFSECGKSADSILILSFRSPSPNPDAIITTGCPGSTLTYTDPNTGIETNITSDTVFIVEVPDSICNYMLSQVYEFIFEESDQDVKERIPNAFTPNGDSMNDNFGFAAEENDVVNFTSYKMTIFNRWGQEVFATTSIDEKWDGRISGENAVSEVYLYVIDVMGNLNGCIVDGSYTGDVTLVR